MTKEEVKSILEGAELSPEALKAISDLLDTVEGEGELPESAKEEILAILNIEIEATKVEEEIVESEMNNLALMAKDLDEALKEATDSLEKLLEEVAKEAGVVQTGKPEEVEQK